MSAFTSSRGSALALKPAVTPLNVVLTVAGFVAWWPLGAAMIAWMIWGDRMQAWWNRNGDQVKSFDPVGAMKSASQGFGGFKPTGNAAFDDYRAQTLARLEEERRKLADEERQFGDFIAELRKARDKEEFERFMVARKTAGHRPVIEG
jgi:Protein of unknown function (DUF2852)